MTAFALRYGNQELTLSQSKTLIGVRPQRHRAAEAKAAVGQVLGGDWLSKGAIGGFDIIALTSAEDEADQVLDEIRRQSPVDVGTHVFEAAVGGFYVPTGDLYIEFAKAVPDADQQAVIDEHHLAVKDVRPGGFILTVTPDSSNPVKVAAALQQDDRISVAEPDLASKAVLTAADPLMGDQWHLRNTGRHRGTVLGFKQGADARVIDAWNTMGNAGDPAVVVAVIDDGFDLTHPDFKRPGKLIHPWDFTRKSAEPVPGENDWHGTACAGVAVAVTGGGGVVGAAPNCGLMPLRWGPNLSDEQIEDWFRHAMNRGAWVVSCSWRNSNWMAPLSTRAIRAIEQCAREGRGGRGCVVVFAAGNEGRDINDPAAKSVNGFAIHPDVIAVAACTSRDERSSYSNFGAEISVAAPSSGAGGWGVLTTDVLDGSGSGYLGYAAGDYTYDFGGTSSACPLVAGVAALVLSVNPELTSAEVKSLLQDTARKIGAASDYVNGHSTKFGYGCVDADAAVKAAALAKVGPGVGSPTGASASLVEA